MELGTAEQSALDDETMWCLVEAAPAANFPLGFIGNEYSQPTKRPSRVNRVTSVGFGFADPLTQSRRLFDAAPTTLRVGGATLGR